MRRVRAIVSGRVQGVSYRASTGVSYRASTADEARDCKLTGWVRNLADGSVELEAQGPEDQVAALLAWCRGGPPSARVDHVAVDDRDLIDGESSFEIRRR